MNSKIRRASDIRQAIDAQFSGVSRNPELQKNVLRQVRGEIVVKKKVSAALVFALALVLIAGMAVAAISLRDTARQIVETEQTDGYYEDWPVEKKISLVSALVDLKYIEETAEMKQLIAGSLPAKEANRAANEAVARFTGMEVSEVSFMGIMQAAWGPFGEWTREEQAWYSQLMVDMGIQKEDHTLYVMPKGPVDEAAATAIARREIAKGYGVEESALEGYRMTVSFQVPEFAEPGDKQPYWCVELTAPEGMAEDKRLFRMFWVFIHPETGELYESVESMLAQRRAQEAYMNDPVFQAIGAFTMEHSNFNRMSLSGRARWSQTIRPIVLKKQQEDPDFFSDETGSATLLASVAFVYGVPDEAALPQDEALALAERALVDALGRKEAEIKFYAHRMDVYYDVTDPEKPLWKFFFRMPNPYDSDEAFGAEVAAYYGQTRPLSYKVELDARTGAVVKAFGLEWGDLKTLQDHMLPL